MVEDDSSMVLNTKFTHFSDSGNSSYRFWPNKRSWHDHNGSLARFKGVVSQQNGHWGAQIYANHQRIWLGTFKSDKEATTAYDNATIKLRSGDTHRNFPWTDLNIQELDFQNLYSTEDVLNMIRDSSYEAKFEDFAKISSKKHEKLSTNNLHIKLVHGDTQISCMQLFKKELTPSDVGKLNRLVIPKRYVVKHFPHIRETDQQSLVSGVEHTELVFYDRLMVIWRFRYYYWRSSQSFVFTKGWSRFVKEKRLGEKDTVTFYTCERPGEDQNGRNFFLIDVNYNGESCCIGETDKKAIVTLESSTDDRREYNLPVELELILGKKSYFGNTSTNQFNEVDEAVDEYEYEWSRNVKAKNVTLFGVQIN